MFVCLVHLSESLSEIRSRVSFLEEELSVKDTMLKATQGEMVQCKKELAAKEIILQKTQARIRQESERVNMRYCTHVWTYYDCKEMLLF